MYLWQSYHGIQYLGISCHILSISMRKVEESLLHFWRFHVPKVLDSDWTDPSAGNFGMTFVGLKIGLTYGLSEKHVPHKSHCFWSFFKWKLQILSYTGIPCIPHAKTQPVNKLRKSHLWKLVHFFISIRWVTIPETRCPWKLYTGLSENDACSHNCV